MRRRSDDRHKPGFGPEPGLMTCHKLGLDAETRAYDGRRSVRRTVVSSSSCRRHVVVMPSSCRHVYSRRAVSTSSSCCRAIAVRPSAHCRRAVGSIVIWTRRDLSYPTSACLLNMLINICNMRGLRSLSTEINLFLKMSSPGNTPTHPSNFEHCRGTMLVVSPVPCFKPQLQEL